MERIAGTKWYGSLSADYFRGNFDVLRSILANFLDIYRRSPLPVLRAGILVRWERDKVTAIYTMLLPQCVCIHIRTFSHIAA